MQPAPGKVASPSAELADADRRNYEIAEHLARIDPRYKDAPKIILDNIARAETYAEQWEAANPGKEFDPRDEEHDEFFGSVQQPWTPDVFRDAEVDLAAEKKMAKFKEEQSTSMRALQSDQAHMELASVVDRHFVEATATLAKMVGDDVHQALATAGWDGLHKNDPVTAQVLATTLDQMHPFIEAAIEIDEPKSRVRLDMNKPSHQQWNQVVAVGEARLTGQQLDDGRVFASRAEWAKLDHAQRSTRWYLTTEMIIQGALDYAADQVKSVAEAQKKHLASLGFVRSGQNAQPGAGTPATPQPPAPTPVAPPAHVEKPVSPTVGSGAKIDDTGGKPKTAEGALMAQFSKVRSGS